MNKRDLPFVLGVISIIFAILPFFPRLICIIGAIFGIWGALMATSDLNRYRHDGSLKIARILCVIGAAASIIIFIYFK